MCRSRTSRSRAVTLSSVSADGRKRARNDGAPIEVAEHRERNDSLTLGQSSVAWRARRYVLIPVIPILTIVAPFGLFFVESVLPPLVGLIAGLIAWAGTLYHAARRARPKWVVAIAV